jgi:hypothetical protein
MNYHQSMRALAQSQNDALISPRFFILAVEDPLETKKQGRPIFRDAEFVEIKFAGDTKRIHVAPAHEAFKRDPKTNQWTTYAEEYAPIYQRFKEGLTDQDIGTPLEEAPFLSASKRSELRALNIKTLEALSALDGDPLKRLGMGGRELKNQAIAYLEKASGSADVVRMAAENEALKEQMALLQQQMAELIAAKGSPTKPEEPAGPSPFDDWSNEDLHNWLKDNGAPADARCNRQTLVKKANELNTELAKKAAA